MKSRSGRILSPLLMPAILFPFGDGNMAQEKVTLTFVCCADNDLCLAVKAAGIRTQRYDSPEAALDAVLADGGMLILADGYPDRITEISPAVFERIEANKIRLYVEYPSAAASNDWSCHQILPPRSFRCIY